ncbi:MAG: hypothetical protein J5912_04365 [Clostridia bacterium]|nr:hypothetical protein [Clostridia bacterium]
MYYSKDMETFASGLKKIKTLCTEAGVRYEFQKEAYGFTVVFYRHCGEGWGWSGNNEGSQKDTQGDNGTLDGTLSPSEKQQMQIRTMIKQNNKITRKAMAAELGISERSVQRILNSMPDIRFTGGGRSGHWEISDPQE